MDDNHLNSQVVKIFEPYSLTVNSIWKDYLTSDSLICYLEHPIDKSNLFQF